MATGPLRGVRIVEFAGIGPGPYASMMLSDMGADVVTIARPGQWKNDPRNFVNRGRRPVELDLKKQEDIAQAMELIACADALIEGFRPKVMERLGLGPDEALKRNPRLVYGRMTGWGQDGPYAAAAGHDINYISLAGALEPIGRRGEAPVPPLNLVGDFGGGGMFLAFGIACGIVEAQRSGQGQVIDAAMVDGAASLMTMTHSFRAMGIWNDERGTNMLDTGAHYYDVYETADGKYVSIGSIEPQFYAELLRLTGLEGEELPWQQDRSHWPELKERFAAIFRTKSRAEWCELMEGTDVCFAPVLAIPEAVEHPHNVARGTFVEVAGITQPGPAPRFSRTPGEIRRPPPHAGQHTDEVLRDAGLDADAVAKLRAEGAVA
ncbi:MAG: CaiB/BaiF CoA transferase family protein [Acidimicrobiales bacterium]